MSFIEMIPARQGRKSSEPVHVALTAKHLRIMIDRQFCSRLRWHKGMRIRVHRGEGSDAGKLRLVPGTPGYTVTLRSPAHSVFEVLVPPWAGLPHRAVSAIAVGHALVPDYQADADTVEITLPSWGLECA